MEWPAVTHRVVRSSGSPLTVMAASPLRRYWVPSGVPIGVDWRWTALFSVGREHLGRRLTGRSGDRGQHVTERPHRAPRASARLAVACRSAIGFQRAPSVCGDLLRALVAARCWSNRTSEAGAGAPLGLAWRSSQSFRLIRASMVEELNHMSAFEGIRKVRFAYTLRALS